MKANTLRARATALFVLLAAQFVLGMTLNLYISLPSTFPGDTGGYLNRIVHGLGWALTSGGGIILLLHVIVALCLVIGAVLFFIQAILVRHRTWLIVASFGLLGVLAALFNGLSFISYDGKNISSFIMAMGYITASLAYGSSLRMKRP